MDKGTGKDKDRRIPGATYRVQLTKDFTFRQATELVDYWHRLGITDLYAAPFLKARPGSVHGYDVVDPTALNPEIGTEDDLGQLHEALASHGMGLVMDVVPNHMCITTNDNVWWNNVLENGPSSPFARYFDIDWHPPKTELHDKVLLPILGDQYGRVLEAGELQVREADGGFVVEYYQRRFPVGPGTYPVILRGMLDRLARADNGGTAAHALGELLALAESLPPRSATGADDVARRQRDKETLKQRLRALLAESPAARAALDEDLRDLNGTKGQPRSFDRLEQLLAVQAYRLSYWRVAAEQINYRRFFEINDLAAIRIEEPEVLAAVHGKPLELLKKGWVTGLRVDHVDGLREPRRYLDELRAKTEGAYVVVEKILGRDERLPRSWATEGTAGYEFLNILNALFVSRSGERALRSLYDGLRTVKGGLPDVVYEAKRLVLSASMSSELSVLARRLDRISEQHRWSRDFTAGTLLQVLADTIACFPVYRTYIAAGDTEVAPQELQYIREALLRARRRNPTIESSAFDFLSEVLLMRDPEGLSEGDRAERRDFVLRFQQLTGPVMAKGLEDTSFYRYFPLLSLDEVGGDPDRFGLTIEEFHRLMEERARERPAALSGTSTHDTKRGEDARIRLNVLSEIPEEWAAAVTTWREAAARFKTRVDDAPAPDADDEYYLYQTVVGALPYGKVDAAALEAFVPRVQAAIQKALREGKRNSSWTAVNEPYEQATEKFVAGMLDPTGPLYPLLSAFVARIQPAATLASLSQLTVKVAAPGVPDFFQGTELWTLDMVDPDNRRAVDFGGRGKLLQDRPGPGVAAALADCLRAGDSDGRSKLWLTAALLHCRRREGDLFTRGAYLALAAEGPRRENVVAFARRWQGRAAIAVAGRYFTQLPEVLAGADVWKDTKLTLPTELPVTTWTDVLGGRTITAGDNGLSLSEILADVPFALLVGDVASGVAPERGAA